MNRFPHLFAWAGLALASCGSCGEPDTGDSEGICLFQFLSNLDGSMPIGICLDHGHDFT